jgi:hypothetical protein
MDDCKIDDCIPQCKTAFVFSRFRSNTLMISCHIWGKLNTLSTPAELQVSHKRGYKFLETKLTVL